LDSIKDGPTVKLRITDTAGSRWNCAGFFQWGYELHLDKSHNPVTCYTNSLFQTSANVKVTLLTGTIPGSQEGQRYSYWAGYRLGIVTIRVEPG